MSYVSCFYFIKKKRNHRNVTNFVAVEGAAVPILTFDWEGVNIDLLFARLNSASVPEGFDIDNDAVLDGVDSATEKSFDCFLGLQVLTFFSVMQLKRAWL